jgi:hypothetical protein
MAILKGFPPSNTISPSVKIIEKDLTFVTTTPTLHNVAVVGFASKGPINTPTIVASQVDLGIQFGNPHPAESDPYMIYAALNALLVSNQVYIVRVADTNSLSPTAATLAQVEAPSAGGMIDVISGTAGDYVFGADAFFRWKLNGVLNDKTLVVLAGTYSADELRLVLNAQLDATVDGIEFYDAGSNTIAVKSTWAFGPDSILEFVSVQDSLVGPSSIIGLGTGMTVATQTGSADRYPDDMYHSAGDWDFTGVTGLNLVVVVDGTDNVNIDNIAQIIDLSALDSNVYASTAALVVDIQAAIAAEAGGFECVATGNNLTLRTLHAGRTAAFAVKATSTADTVFGFTNLANYGTSPLGAADDPAVDTLGRITGTDNAGGAEISCTITADSVGLDGNYTTVVIKNDTAGGTFSMKVFTNGNPVESWGNLTKDENSQYYVGTYLNLVSDYIRVSDDTTVGAPPADTTDQGITLSGGTDGVPTDPDDQDTLLIGSPISFSGIFALSEPEQIDIDLVAVPGHSSTRVIVALLDMCQNYRSDCLAIIDPPFGLTPSEIVNWQNGSHPLNNVRFDSDFGALFWPWVKVRDNYNAENVWVPPSGNILATICRSDTIAFPWFAPAGYTRGIVPGILDVYSKPTVAERDLMYGYRNCINPIISFPDVSDFLLWGQKTLQRMPSALDRINVRRLMFYIEKNVKAQAKALLFEPHTAQLRNRFVLGAKRILDNVKANQGIYDFVIKCDEELNPPDVIDRNEMRARIGVQPVRAAEFIFVEFSLHKTGTFNENTSVVV